MSQSKNDNCGKCGSDREMLTEDVNAAKRCADCGTEKTSVNPIKK